MITVRTHKRKRWGGLTGASDQRRVLSPNLGLTERKYRWQEAFIAICFTWRGIREG